MEWNSIKKEQCKKLIGSCALRCAALIKNNGFFIKYYSINYKWMSLFNIKMYCGEFKNQPGYFSLINNVKYSTNFIFKPTYKRSLCPALRDMEIARSFLGFMNFPGDFWFFCGGREAICLTIYAESHRKPRWNGYGPASLIYRVLTWFRDKLQGRILLSLKL